jgi:xanthine dehydrogenase accessory factor
VTLEIWRSAVEEFERGRDFVLATILDVQGSSPRHVGTRFLVKKDGTIVGTIGGGLFEAQVQEFAGTVMDKGVSHRASFSFQGVDAQSTEMICGGDAEVILEFVEAGDKANEALFRRLLAITRGRKQGLFFIDVPIAPGGLGKVQHLLIEPEEDRLGGFPNDETAVGAVPPKRMLKSSQLLDVPGFDHPVFLEWLRPKGTAFIFGAGHVGECVAHMAAYVDFRVVILDDRAEFASVERIPDADNIVVVESFDRGVHELGIDEDGYVVIVTRGHAHDKTVLAEALKTEAGYIGMIGSRRKTGLIYKALLEEGFNREDLERVHAPIGLPIGGETPQEIAVSIIAEMIQIRNRKDRLKSLDT